MTCIPTDTPRRARLPLDAAGLWRRLLRRPETAVAAQRLCHLDDHLLRDIGLDRADIAAVVRGR